MPTPPCPRCGSKTLEIVYGLPAPELFDAADRGEVVLGGCGRLGEEPDFKCAGVDCGIEFARRLRRPPAAR